MTQFLVQPGTQRLHLLEQSSQRLGTSIGVIPINIKSGLDAGRGHHRNPGLFCDVRYRGSSAFRYSLHDMQRRTPDEIERVLNTTCSPKWASIKRGP